MRIGPSDVLLRLVPDLYARSPIGGARHVAAVELCWQSGRRWRRKTFVHGDGSAGLAPVLRDLADWLEACGDLDSALRDME